MNRSSIVAVLLFCSIVFFAHAGENPLPEKVNSIGVNILHPIIIESFTQALLEESHHIPIHVSYSRVFNQNWGLCAQLLYFYEKNYNYNTNNIGFAAGPRFSFDFLDGFFVDLKLGLSYTFGTEYNSENYMRLDLVLYPEIGWNFFVADFVFLTLGIGLRSLIQLAEDPLNNFTWGAIGQLAHYYMPVANFSVNFVF